MQHRQSLLRLTENDYLVQEGDSYRIRVPLFEQWLKKYAFLEG